MAIEVHCDCGNVYTVGVELSGKKLRCKTCNVVLKVPLVPVHESSEAVPPSMEYEVVKDDASSQPVVCATCGAAGKPGDSVCLACGATLGAGGPALVPKQAIFAGIGVLALILVAVIGITIYRSMHLSALLAKGHEKLDKGELAPAKSAFEEALKASRDNTDALDGLVQVGLAGPNWSLVKSYGERLIAKLPAGAPGRGRTLADVARAHLETGEYGQAEKCARDAMREDSSLGHMDEVVALALLGAGKPEALEALKKADSNGTQDPRIALGVAKLVEPTSVHEARAWLDKAAGLADKDAAVWLECARLRDKDGDKTGALGALEHAAHGDPRSVAAHVKLAQAYLDAKDSKALDEAKAAKALAPDDPLASRTLGAALLQAGDAKSARTELERAEKLAPPDDPLPSFLLGKALVLTGEVNSGIERLERALKKSERDPRPWLDAGRIALVDAKQPEKAVAFLEHAFTGFPRPAATATPEQKSMLGETGVLLARALAQGDGAREQHARRIEDVLKEALDVDPKRREVYLEYGTHQGELNNWKGALDVLERGLQVFPDDEDLLYRAGDAGIKVGGKDGNGAAVEHLTKLVGRRPDYPHAQERLDVAKRELDMANQQ